MLLHLHGLDIICQLVFCLQREESNTVTVAGLDDCQNLGTCSKSVAVAPRGCCLCVDYAIGVKMFGEESN